MKKSIYLLAAGLLSTAGARSAVINGSFETPTIPSGTWDSTMSNVPGWHTTEPQGQIEIWNNFAGEAAYDGAQFIEVDDAVYQDITISSMSLVSYAFAHQGRTGVDTIRVDVTYAGLDALFGTADDQVVVDGSMASNQYSTGSLDWVLYGEDGAFTTADGGLYRFSFEGVSTSTGEPEAGNFLDAVSVRVDPIPEPTGAAMASVALCLLGWRRKSRV